MYDIIGDVHGHYDHLVTLLKRLGYASKGGSYKHPERKAIFIGDFINRGDKIRQTVQLIRRMTEQEDAVAIVGNHEMNAILYSTIDKSGKTLQKQLLRNKMPLISTFSQYAKYPEEWKDTVKWFRTLPIYLDLGDLRVVHGGWNPKHIETLNQWRGDEPKLKKKVLKESLVDEALGTALNELLRGVEMQLPSDIVLRDEKGISHRRFRIKWWEPADGKTFREVSFGNRFTLPAYTIPPELTPKIEAYPENAPPVFIGHYCLDAGPLIIKPNICCVDNCIARSQKLTAYRWNGERILSEKNLVYSTP